LRLVSHVLFSVSKSDGLNTFLKVLVSVMSCREEFSCRVVMLADEKFEIYSDLIGQSSDITHILRYLLDVSKRWPSQLSTFQWLGQEIRVQSFGLIHYFLWSLTTPITGHYFYVKWFGLSWDCKLINMTRYMW
jgi:hypothetical protein